MPGRRGAGASKPVARRHPTFEMYLDIAEGCERRPPRPGETATGAANAASARQRHADNRTDLAEKAHTCMYEDDDEGRIEAAEQLARHDKRAAAGAFRDIADDEGVDAPLRLEAAEHLAELERRSAAEAFRGIAADAGVDGPLRVEAAEHLPDLDERLAAEAFRGIAADEGVDDGLRLEAAERLAGLDPESAAEAYRGIADDDRPQWRGRPAGAAATLPRPLRPPKPPKPPKPPRPW